MRRVILTIFYAFACLFMHAQISHLPLNAPLPSYRATAEKVNDLVHTKLEAKFDYTQSYLYGKVWLTLQPHFYPTDSLQLDAKGMDIKQVSLVNNDKKTPLKFRYDGLNLNIDLNKMYKGGEKYTIYIDYVAKPNEFKSKGSAAITEAKGLYFINPKGEDKNKPTQIWTQGETEANSVWIPIIDKPNQKTTQEFYLTVPAKYVTLSNGKLMSQKNNTDGTRTDYWKMDLPHSPYLFFMGVGDYAIIKDSYKGKEVSYYVEKAYAPVARKIFGNTPEMMAFYSRITGVEYPWVKYSQIVGRDYVSGAMENTTATLHQESAQQDARELSDGNDWERVIAHELFHQWFGDLVTTESWSNLTLNESFANYSEYLWNEYKYGKDAADEHNYSDMQGYIHSGSDKKDLVRFQYNDKEDMFDAVSYNKGGRILHMLRNYVGDSAFFKSLNLYLTNNKFKSAEAHQLRLAFEEVTGKDLNWFWNQWYFGNGHPKLNITYKYNNEAKQAQVIVEQKQNDSNLFVLPAAIDIWHGNNRIRYNVWVQHKVDTFLFASMSQPDLINFDADKILLAEKNENKTLAEYQFQIEHARNYLDRREAIDAAAQKQEEQKAVEILIKELNDPYSGLRAYTIGQLDLKKQAVKTSAENTLAQLAEKDKDRKVKAAAIEQLSEYGLAKYQPVFLKAASDSSYTVAGNALEALRLVNDTLAYRTAKQMANEPAKGKLAAAVGTILITHGDEEGAGMLVQYFEQLNFGQEKVDALQPLITAIATSQKMENVQRGVNALQAFKSQVPQMYQAQFAPAIDNVLKNLQRAKLASGLKEQADYIQSTIK